MNAAKTCRPRHGAEFEPCAARSSDSHGIAQEPDRYYVRLIIRYGGALLADLRVTFPVPPASSEDSPAEGGAS